MDIKELCRLCRKYDANQISIELERSFKNYVIDKWDENSEGMKKINSKISYLEGENNMLQQKIESVANVDFTNN